MAIAVAVSAADKTAFVRYRTLRIQKDGAIETCRVEFLDRDVTAAAFRPFEDTLTVTWDGGLEFGGEIVTSDDVMLDAGTGGGTVTVVEARGWYYEAEDVSVTIDLPAQGLYTTAEQLRALFLAAKGWTNIGSTSGGLTHVARSYVRTTVRAIFDDLQNELGIPWRVNGARQFAFVPVGSLVYAHTLGDTGTSKVLRGLRSRRTRVRQATRIFVTTGGTGTVQHHETHTAAGRTTIPINVLPSRQHGTAAFPASAAATTIVVKGLLPTRTIHAGRTFAIRGEATGYTVTGDAATDGNGTATVGCTPGLATALEDGDAVSFDEATFIELEVDGTPTPLDGSPWAYDRISAAFVTSGSAPTTITYRVPVTAPAVCRAWDSSAVLVSGAWNYATVRDAHEHVPDQTDIVQATAYGYATLAERVLTPREVTLFTREPGLYPWLRVALSFAARLITGNYLVQSTTLEHDGRVDQRPHVTARLLEGDVLGRTWVDAIRQRQGGGGSGGSVVTGSSGGIGPAPGGGVGTPTGTVKQLGGSNSATLLATTSWQDIPEACRERLGGAAMAGTWRLWVPMYQLAAGTMEVRLYDQTTAAALATVSTTATGAYVDGSHFAFADTTFAAPTSLDDVLLQVRVTSGSRAVVVGHAALIKE